MAKVDPEVRRLYQAESYNCAEAVLLLSSERYGMELRPEEVRLLSGFGGGMGCGKTCGAVAGALAVLSRLTVKDRAHATENFRGLTSGLIGKLEEALGSTDCREIMPRFRTAEDGCAPTIETAMEVLDSYLREHGIVK